MSPLLSSVPDLMHAFTVRGSDPLAVLRDGAGRPLQVHTVRQVHGSSVHEVTRPTPPREHDRPEGDALITRVRGIALRISVADCVPILICHERAGAIAAVHAGWRGTLAGVLPAAIRALLDRFDADAAALRVALGPAIGPCCFEVGEEVADAFRRADPGTRSCVLEEDGRPRIDLIAVNRMQAAAAGVPESALHSIDLCTMCRADLLESHRRDRGRAGRMAAIIAWRA